MVRRTLAELKANPPKFSAKDRHRLATMSDEAIDLAARNDPDNPEWSDEKLARAVFARDVKRARALAKLSQEDFARRFHISTARLRDWEQARFKPDSVAAAYIKIILREPDLVARILASD